MSKLDELITNLCPNGVQYFDLAKVCEVYDGTHQTPEYTTTGVKFVSVQNISALYETNKYISQADYEKFRIKPQKGDVFMTRIGSIGVCAVVDSDEPLGYYVSLALLRPDQSKITSNFLKHIIESNYGKKELLKRTLVDAVPIKINKNEIGKIIIPVPPLEVQEEIVRILDEYSEKNTQLITALSAELDARKVQYEYYRSMLFSFDRMALSGPVEQMTIGDIGKISMCKRVLKSQTSDEGEIPFYKIGTFGRQANAFITKELFEEYKSKYSYPNKGDILISASGTIGRTVVFDGEPAYFQDSNIVWVANDESKVTNAYLQLYYKTSPWKPREGGTITRLYNDIIESTPIAVPSKDDQANIVEKFGCLEETYTEYFDNLENEIKLRQTQYEYYRDKLLTFEEEK